MFSNLKRLLQRRAAYKDVFTHPQAKNVLADLKRFCYYDKPNFNDADVTGRRQAFIEGRRDVLLRILGFMNATEEQITQIKEDYPDA